jgi:Lrp/AsnC family transcriptional regulator, leucine-responsive regulatory protein
MKNGNRRRRRYLRLELDQIDCGIVGELTAEGRLPLAELGRRVNLSPPAVAERVQRLEEAGVIAGYRAVIDPRALGYTLTAIIRMRPVPGRAARVTELALDMPEVVECHRITGEDCFYVRACLRAIEDLNALLDRFQTCGETTTSIVRASPIPYRDPPVLVHERG